jgi:hypothetical protein
MWSQGDIFNVVQHGINKTLFALIQIVCAPEVGRDLAEF